MFKLSKYFQKDRLNKKVKTLGFNIEIEMVLYRCLCGYETSQMTSLKRHINIQNSCTPNIKI